MGAAPVGHVDQFEAAPAQIADNPARIGKGAEHAVGAGDRLFLAAEQAGFEAEVADRIQEGLAIARIAAGGGCHHVDFLNPLEVEDRTEPRERGEREGHGLGGKIAAFGHPFAQPRGDFLVVQHLGGAQRLAIDDQPDRIRADIDDRARTGAGDTGQGLHHAGQATVAPPRRSASLGTLRPVVRAAPRPESEGLVMK